jgi:hypothetical protein
MTDDEIEAFWIRSLVSMQRIVSVNNAPYDGVMLFIVLSLFVAVVAMALGVR